MREHSGSLDDFPLHGGAPEVLGGRESPGWLEPSASPVEIAAPLPARCTAAAADVAAIVLIGAIAILGARAATGSGPRPAGVAWAIGFLIYLSLFATVPPLLLFGKTIGMALAEISALPEVPGSRLSPAAALRRWLGTLGTVATGGLLLLWTARSPEAPTPADRLSGHPLTLD